MNTDYLNDTESEPEVEVPNPVPKPKAQKKESKPKEKPTPTLVPLADTTDLKYLGEIDLETEHLKTLFGKPQENPDQDPETMDWRYEYKVKVGTKLYSVYDKLNEDDTFDPEDQIEWFVNGTGSIKHLLSAF